MHSDKKTILKGIPASPGTATGTVRVIKEVEDKEIFQKGNILVTTITDPSMVTMMAQAAAIICDLGGITSHPAIVSREMGIPCIVNTKEATKILDDGIVAEVNGTTGEIRIIEQKKQITITPHSETMPYPRWIDEYARASYQLFAGNTLAVLKPLDLFHFYTLWYDLIIEKLQYIIETIEAHKAHEQTKNHLNYPSYIRTLIKNIIVAYPYLPQKNDEQLINTINFLVQLLSRLNTEDIFTHTANKTHSEVQVKQIIINTPFAQASPDIAKLLGRLNLGLGHLVNSFYNDVITDFGWDVFGPYDVAEIFGDQAILVVRSFPDLTPHAVWSHAKHLAHKHIQVYLIYKTIEQYAIRFIGCHTDIKGDVINNLIYYAVNIDGEWIHNPEQLATLTKHFLHVAVEQQKKVNNLDPEKLKQIVLLQECYPLKKISESLGLDWKPTSDMHNRVQNTPIPDNIFPLGETVNFEQYCNIFGINTLKQIFST